MDVDRKEGLRDVVPADLKVGVLVDRAEIAAGQKDVGLKDVEAAQVVIGWAM